MIGFATGHAPLDSLKHESSYLERRRDVERTVDTMDTPASAELGAATRRTPSTRNDRDQWGGESCVCTGGRFQGRSHGAPHRAVEP